MTYEDFTFDGVTASYSSDALPPGSSAELAYEFTVQMVGKSGLAPYYCPLETVVPVTTDTGIITPTGISTTATLSWDCTAGSELSLFESGTRNCATMSSANY